MYLQLRTLLEVIKTFLATTIIGKDFEPFETRSYGFRDINMPMIGDRRCVNFTVLEDTEQEPREFIEFFNYFQTNRSSTAQFLVVFIVIRDNDGKRKWP